MFLHTFLHMFYILQGGVQVIESAQFGISVNISTKGTFELATIDVEYTAINDTILLQLVRIV